MAIASALVEGNELQLARRPLVQSTAKPNEREREETVALIIATRNFSREWVELRHACSIPLRQAEVTPFTRPSPAVCVRRGWPARLYQKRVHHHHSVGYQLEIYHH